MNLLYLSLFALLIASATLIAQKKWFAFALGAMAVPCVINVSFYPASEFAIQAFGMSFGFDGILYTVFIYSVFLMYFRCGKKNTWEFIISAMVGIVFAGTFSFVAQFLTKGNSEPLTYKYISFYSAIVATVATTFPTIKIMEKLKEKKVNDFLCIIILSLFMSVMHSVIFFATSPLTYMHKDITSFALVIAPLYIMKGITTAIVLLVHLVRVICAKYIKPKAKKEEANESTK
jgi:hypothetical protein